MSLFGLSLSSLFGNRRSTKRRVSHMTKKHNKLSRHEKKGHRRGTRKYKMRGG